MHRTFVRRVTLVRTLDLEHINQLVTRQMRLAHDRLS